MALLVPTGRTPHMNAGVAAVLLSLTVGLSGCSVKIGASSKFACAGADGETCDDGDPCTTGDRCLAGKCTPTGPAKCGKEAGAHDTMLGDSSGSDVVHAGQDAASRQPHDSTTISADGSGASSSGSSGINDASGSSSGSDASASSGSGADSSGGQDGTGPGCIDKDKDLFGVGCAAGPDCDDANPVFNVACPDCTKSFPGCSCQGGTIDCYIGPAATKGVGACKAGKQKCIPQGGGFSGWGQCEGMALPTAEVCDGKDNDCDGETDEGVRSSCGTCDPSCVKASIGKDQAVPFHVAPGIRNADVDDKGVLRVLAPPKSWDHLWVAHDGAETVARIEGVTKKTVAGYAVCPGAKSVAVDGFGDGWIGCTKGGAVALISANPAHCVDKNGNGKIETSKDADGNGSITKAEVLALGSDECVRFRVAHSKATAGVNAIAAGPEGLGWIAPTGGKKLLALDPNNGAIAAERTLSCSPAHMVADPTGALYATGGDCTDLWRVATLAPIVDKVKAAPSGFSLDKTVAMSLAITGDVWVSVGTKTMGRFLLPDQWKIATTPQVVTAIIAAGTDKSAADSAVVVFPAQGSVVPYQVPVGSPSASAGKSATLKKGAEPQSLALGTKYVWAANTGDNTLAAIDTAAGTFKTIEAGSLPSFRGDGSGLVRRARETSHDITVVQRLLHPPVGPAGGPHKAITWSEVTVVAAAFDFSPLEVAVRAAATVKQLTGKSFTTLNQQGGTGSWTIPAAVGHGAILDVQLKSIIGDSNTPLVSRITAIGKAN